MRRTVVPARVERLEDMLGFIMAEAEAQGFDMRELGRLRLACEEALINIILYAYPGRDGSVEIGCDVPDVLPGLVVELTDQGAFFNPLAAAPPVLAENLNERKIGGLGIFFIRRLMDEIIYRRDGNKNVLTLVKYCRTDPTKGDHDQGGQARGD